MPKIDCYCKSDVGRKRHNNEDAYFIEPDIGVITVVDGMGGVSFGEVASKIFEKTASEVFLNARESAKQKTPELIKGLVEKAFRSANKKIQDYAAKNPSHHGMGCTAELIAFHDQKFVLGHVGDSRTYLYRMGKLEQITRDHSLIQDQIDMGLLTKHEAKKSSHRNVVLRAVGVQKDFLLDVIMKKFMRGDVFLLCTDGLTDMVEDIEIEKALSSNIKLHEKVENLINLANSAGGHDNITVALCEIVE